MSEDYKVKYEAARRECLGREADVEWLYKKVKDISNDALKYELIKCVCVGCEHMMIPPTAGPCHDCPEQTHSKGKLLVALRLELERIVNWPLRAAEHFKYR